MGTWGHKPLENDFAADLLVEFNDSKDLTLLERVFDAVNLTEVDGPAEAPASEEAVAAAQILRDLTSEQIKEEDKQRLIVKANNALKRVLENSELQELWQDSDEYVAWAASVGNLINE